jgi:hypothetical protein
MIKKYDNLMDLENDIILDRKKDLTEELSCFSIKTDLNKLDHIISNMSVTDKVIAFKMIHQRFLEINKNMIEIFTLRSADNDSYNNIIKMCNETTIILNNRLKQIEDLISLSLNENNKLPYNINEVYEVLDWSSAYCAQTSEQYDNRYIKSKKAKIIQNSEIETAYYAFIIGITAYDTFIKDDSNIPFIIVEPVYGLFKGNQIVFRTDKLKTK